MTNEINITSDIIVQLVLQGDVSKMNDTQKVAFYNKFCEKLGLNPLTQPFQIIKFQGKEKLYATKDCTDQLRKLHGVSITELTTKQIADVLIVTAKAIDANGKTDISTGAVSLSNLSGEALANATMKAETKAKRRVTLSICGLGILDESETDTMPPHTIRTIPEIKSETPAVPPAGARLFKGKLDDSTPISEKMKEATKEYIKSLNYVEQVEKANLRRVETLQTVGEARKLMTVLKGNHIQAK